MYDGSSGSSEMKEVLQEMSRQGGIHGIVEC